jgi:predicted transcriptional regulator
MARPKLYDEPRTSLALRLPKSLREELQAAADGRDVSVNFLVNRAICDYLKAHPTAALDPGQLSSGSVAS